MPSRRTTSTAVVAALVLAAGATTLLPGAAPVASAAGLTPYAGCGELLEHYRSALAQSATPWGSGGGRDDVMAVASSPGGAADSARAEAAAVGAGPTGTNLQEQGVDEPDVAKTVDGVLYALGQGRLQLVATGPQPRLLGSLPLGVESWGTELLVQGDRVLVLLGGGYAGGPADVRLPGGGAGGTRLLLVDVADPAAPRLLESLELTGRYLSARLSDGAVRLVTTSSPQVMGVTPAEPYGAAQEQAARDANVRAARSVGLDQVLPQAVRRDASGAVLSQGRAVGCDAVQHAPSPRGESVLLLSTLDLSRGLAAVDTTAVTTDGELVYASADRLYVATSRWGTTAPTVQDDRPQTSTATSTTSAEHTVTTELHAFDTTSPTSTSYAGTGSVRGYVLGRWALSSYGGHLRVATTSAAPWGGGPTTSAVTVLAERPYGLVETGRIDGLGVGERIYAVRYFRDLATVVTFRQTDPLYLLDLADPTAPRVTGELKVPGFSTYLHPLGDDLLLGVGQDADAQGRVTGAQVSVFDLSDRTRPVQVDRLPLGQGWSPAGDDSRAFGYDPARRLVLLPFSRYDGSTETSVALGIAVGTDGRLSPAGQLRREGRLPVERVLHDGRSVYAVGQDGVAAGSADTLGRTGGVVFGR
ncbi:MAG: hypothetical protein JWN08_880 [Frankiales bacterium]|nr:hypothetical protein [Frankiales bacterium]